METMPEKSGLIKNHQTNENQHTTPQINHDKERISCENCLKDFKKTYLPVHQKRCLKLQEFKCSECDYVAPLQSEVKAHA